LMAFEVVALPSTEFDAWLSREAGPAPAPPPDAGRRGPALCVAGRRGRRPPRAARRGRALSAAAGCGTCHATRGTAAGGTIGPDLTHIASRRSVGIDTMKLTHANLVRFIAEGQHVKP